MSFIAHASGSAGNLYQVISGDKSLIIDPGIPIAKIKRALNFKLSRVSGVLISHSHGDHSKGVQSLAKMGLNCWMSEPTAIALEMIGHHRTKIIQPGLPHPVDDNFAFIAFDTQHDCPGSIGFLIDDGVNRLLFATDTFYIHNRFAGVNIMAVECNYSKKTLDKWLHPERKKRLYKSHFSLENVIKFLRANDLSRVREIHLIHMSQQNADPVWFKKEIERATGIQTITH